MKGLFLGLASGANCLATCAPVLLSLLAAEAGRGWQGFRLVGWFLLGRMAAYASHGVIAAILGSAGRQVSGWSQLVLGSGLVAFSVLLLRYGFASAQPDNPAEVRKPGCLYRRSYRTPVLALTGGLVTGVNPCAPVLLAFTAAAQTGNLFQCVSFFLWFFLGTAVYLVPLPLVGFLGRSARLRLVARLAVGVMGAYYLYAGLMLAIKGGRSLLTPA